MYQSTHNNVYVVIKQRQLNTQVTLALMHAKVIAFIRLQIVRIDQNFIEATQTMKTIMNVNVCKVNKTIYKQ